MRRNSCALFFLFSLFGLGAFASIPVATGPDVVWHGDFDGNGGVLNGNCDPGEDGYCRAETVRSDQIQFVQSPLAEGQFAARYEVRHDDVYTDSRGVTYSESRTLMDPSSSAWESEGSEHWYRWQVYLPADYISDFPKWDELGSSNGTTSSRSYGGYNVEWHHDGDGSAPVYLQTKNEHFTLCIVHDFANCAIAQDLMPLVRGRWVDWLMHAKWSSNSSVGFIEIWADSGSGLTLVLPRLYAANMYSGLRNYWTIGLYRNGHVGDPTLHYTNGTQVYPNGPAQPVTVVYFDGFVIGNTKDAIYSGPLDSRPMVSVTRQGSGSGTVTSSPAPGMSCGATCSAGYASGTSVTLTATPDAGSTFGGFGGGCVSSATTCTFTISANTSVTANFSGTPGGGSIAFRGQATYTEISASTKTISLSVPGLVQTNDVLIANIYAGDYVENFLPTITAPAGWTLLRTVSDGTRGVLKIYSRVATSTDPGHVYAWTTNIWVGSASSMLAYSGVDATAPVETSAGQDNASAASTYSAPSVTTSNANDLLIATYASYSQNSPPGSTWSTPTGMTQRVGINNTMLLALSNDDKVQAGAGASGAISSTATPGQTYALTATVALKSAGTGGGGSCGQSYPAVATLTDSFGASSIDLAKWTSTQSQGTTTESGGYLHQTPDANTGSASLLLLSNGTFALTGSSAYVKAAQMVTAGDGVDTNFTLLSDASNLVTWMFENGTLYPRQVVGGVGTNLTTLTYSAAAHAWLRIREAAGVVYWETSSDGQTWTAQATAPTSTVPFVCGIRPAFYTETWGAGLPFPGEARYASFNVPPGGGGGGAAAVSTLVDSFGGSSINTTLWTVDQTAGTVTEGSGSLNLTPNAGATNTGLYLTSVSQYSLVNSQAKLKMTSVPQGSVTTLFRLFKDWTPGEEIGWWYEEGTLFAYYLINGVEHDVAVLNYSASSHAWLRVRHDGATVFWETSADGTNWSVQGSAAASSIPYASSAMNVMISVRAYGSGATSSSPARYSNLN